MSRQSVATALRALDIFSELDETELDELAGRCREVSFGQGEFVFREGASPEALFVVARGRIKVLKHSSRDKELIVGFFGPREIVGEVAVFEDRPYPASAEVVEAATLVVVPRDEFVAFLSRRPQVALRIIRLLSERLRTAQGRLRDSTTELAQQRLARLLLMLLRRMGPRLPFSREELGQMAGLTTETVSRQISELARMGVLHPGRRELVIADESKLEVLSEESVGGGM